MDTLQETLRADPNHGKAQRDLGLLLALRGDLGEALPLLERQVRLDDPNTPVEHLLAYLECIRHVGEHTRVFDVTAAVLRVAPGRVDMHALNAEALEGLGRFDHAEREWQRYVDMLGPTGPADEVATIRRRLAKNALQRDDIHAAVAQLEEAQRAKPDSLEIIAELRDLYEKASRWEDAASLRMREVASSSTAAEKLGHLAALAELYRDRLGDPGRAASMLEAMLAIAPDDVGVLRHLFATQSAAGDFAKVLVAGERLIAIVPEADLDATTLALMARAYDETGADPRLAAQFYTRATAKDPSNAALQARRRELAKAAGDFATYAAVEEATVEQAASEDEKIQRLQDLADIYLKRLGRAKDASTTLERALAIRPDDPAILRRLADATAADPSGYEKAAALYRKLSSQDPLAPDILRILARLYGQAGDTDRAYGHYAALLALAPTDTEAKNFVEACRRARPPAPQRALTDADRMRGLIHPEQSGPIEQLFAPLARFAELAHPGDLTRRGVSERDVLSPTDEKLRQLKDVLEPLGLAQAQVYLWRGGGYACEVELIGRPAMLLGSSLESDENARYRAFLVARTAEIYRTGHTLCTTLSDAELTALLAALCLAVEPAAKPPGVNAQTPNWTAIIGKRMTDPIRAALAPAVLGYLAAAQDANLGAWRRAALSTGSRVAMLVACDIAEAIDAMLRLRGFDYIPDDQRPAVLRESPEELDLLLFSLSDVYFALRQSLGLALRRSK